MSKKKIVTLLVAGILTLGIVGGTLAWFTSSDTVTNKFETAGSINPDPDLNAGIKINEIFNPEEAKKLTPGATVNKDVQVRSTVTYDQFIKVKLTKQFTDKNGNVVTEVKDGNNTIKLDTEKIVLTLKNKGDKEGQWTQSGDYFYYIGKVEGGSYTNTLLDAVTLNANAGNEYKNLGFEVVVEAESIQASNRAYADGWATADLQETFKTLETGKVTAPTDAAFVIEKN